MNSATCTSAIASTSMLIALDPDYDKCIAVLSTGGSACKRSFAGVHSGGGAINFVLCDGSTRAFTITMDLRILASFATISGAESWELP